MQLHPIPVKLQQTMAEFGHAFREKYFTLLEKDVIPVNNGSYGTTPTMVMDRLRKVCEEEEHYPDRFYNYEVKDIYVSQVKSLAKYIGVDYKNLAIVPNATVGINTVLRSIPWDFEKDSVLVHTTSYGACSNTVKFLHDTFGLKYDVADVIYPMEDSELLANFEEKLATGKHRLCMFDMISSMPGVALPYKELIKLCKKYNVLSLIDGAHAIGMVDMDFIDELEPDFLTTNMHKWLSAPKSAAMLYVNPKHHKIIQTNPISWSYVPTATCKSADDIMIEKFWYLGTVSYGPMLCIEEALKFRKDVCGGEDRIRAYQNELRPAAIEAVQKAFGPGSELLENAEGTLAVPGMFNVSLPVKKEYEAMIKKFCDEPLDFRRTVKGPCEATMIREDKAFAPFLVHDNKLWVRFSVYIYNELSDYVKSAPLIRKRLEEALDQKALELGIASL